MVERTHRARRIRVERQQRERERDAREPTRHRDRGGAPRPLRDEIVNESEV
jgi:hypothetical protein